jgi:hypothetical protein
MIVRQSSGHFSREKGTISVRHYRYFFWISQQKPGKRNFGGKSGSAMGHRLTTDGHG